MSADTRVSGGGSMYHTVKIHRIRDCLVGMAGDVALTTKFLAWFRKECPSDELPINNEENKSFCAIVLTPKGLYYYADCCEPDKLKESTYAIGTGAQAAMVAMHLGKTPAQAVREAMRVDENTGGEITELHLSKPAARVKREPKKKEVHAAQVDAPPSNP